LYARFDGRGNARIWWHPGPSTAAAIWLVIDKALLASFSEASLLGMVQFVEFRSANPGAPDRKLPFSCTLDATSGSKDAQSAAQGEGEDQAILLIEVRDSAKAHNDTQGVANASFSAC
jgi:hypothetical protein